MTHLLVHTSFSPIGESKARSSTTDLHQVADSQAFASKVTRRRVNAQLLM